MLGNFSITSQKWPADKKPKGFLTIIQCFSDSNQIKHHYPSTVNLLVQTYLRAFCVSCFSSLKKAILNWCLTNSSWKFQHKKQNKTNI